MPRPAKPPHRGAYSAEILCNQLHALYDLLEKRQQEITADPEFHPGNDALIDELDRVVKRLALIRECFEQFCPS